MIKVYRDYDNIQVYRDQPEKFGKLIYLATHPDTRISDHEQQLLKTRSAVEVTKIHLKDYFGDPEDKFTILDKINKIARDTHCGNFIERGAQKFPGVGRLISPHPLIAPEKIYVGEAHGNIIMQEAKRRMLRKMDDNPEIFQTFKLYKTHNKIQNSAMFENILENVIRDLGFDEKSAYWSFNLIHAPNIQEKYSIEHISNSSALALKDKIEPELYEKITVVKKVSYPFWGKDPIAALYQGASDEDLLRVIGVEPNSDGNTVTFINLDKVFFQPDGYEFIDVSRGYQNKTFDEFNTIQSLHKNKKDRNENYKKWAGHPGNVSITKERVPRWRLIFRDTGEPIQLIDKKGKYADDARWFSDISVTDFRNKKSALNTITREETQFLDALIPDNIIQEIFMGKMPFAYKKDAIKSISEIDLIVEPGERKWLGMN